MPTDQSHRDTPVLDMRYEPTVPAEFLRLTNPTATGQAEGYTIEAQRRAHAGQRGLAIRLTAPDGRTLDILAHLDASTTSASSPMAATFSPAIGVVFHTRPKPEQLATAAERIEAVITVGTDCLARGISGFHELRLLIQSAAEGIDPELVGWWREQFPLEDNAPAGLAPNEVLWLTETGFTPETAREWFADGVAYRRVQNRTEAYRRSVFRDHGWTFTQMRALGDQFGSAAVTFGWAKIDPEQAVLGLRAGLNAGEAARLISRGEWDEEMLAMMAGLLGNHDNPATLAR